MEKIQMQVRFANETGFHPVMIDPEKFIMTNVFDDEAFGWYDQDQIAIKKEDYDAFCAVYQTDGTLIRKEKVEEGYKPSEVVYFRFCSELTKQAKKHVGKKFNEVPELTRILTALEVLEECYPGLDEGIKEKMGF